MAQQFRNSMGSSDHTFVGQGRTLLVGEILSGQWSNSTEFNRVTPLIIWPSTTGFHFFLPKAAF